MNHLASPYPAIPIDLFGSKKHRSLGHGELVFADSSGNIALRAKRQSSRPSSESRHCKRMLLLDTAGIPLFSFYLDHTGTWKVFKLDGDQEKRLILTAQKTRRTLMRTEFDVVLSAEISDGSTASFRMVGFPFQRSCTIYRGDSIAAQEWERLIAGHGPDMFHKFSLMKTALLPSLPLDTPEESEEEEKKKEEEE